MQALVILDSDRWDVPPSQEASTAAITALEHGKIVWFPHLGFPVNLSAVCETFTELKRRAKHMSYEIQTDALSGYLGSRPDVLRQLMKQYALQSYAFLVAILPRYVPGLRQARTSFRPVDISGRVTSYRKDDTRLHIDAFAATPVHGKRILRIFTNVNPAGQPRVWRVGEPFAEVVARFLPHIPQPIPGSARVLKALQLTKSRRTLYDHIMLQLHDRMKADVNYQQHAPQVRLEFPASSTWIAFTDQVSHAAMSGQYLLEQSFYLAVEAMQRPELAPISVLQQLTKKTLI